MPEFECPATTPMTEDDLNLLVLRSCKRASGWLVDAICLAIALSLLATAALGAESQPVKLTHLGEWPGHLRPGPHASGIVMSGTYAYIGGVAGNPAFSGAVRVIDFKDTQNPVDWGWFAAEASSFAVRGPHLYEAGRPGFRVLDISNPATPVPIASIPTPTPAGGVAVSGQYAYVTAGSSGLYVMDINNPANPVIVGRLERRVGGSVALLGNFAFIQTWGKTAFDIIDINDPSKPMLVKTVTIDPSNFFRPVDIAIDGNYAYFAGRRLEIFDITDPANPILRSEVSIPNLDPNEWAEDIQVHNGRAYVAAQKAGLHVFDVRDKANPTLLGQYDTDGKALGVWLQGDHVYIAADSSGVQVVDLRDPANPRLAGSYETSGYSRSIAILQGHAFLAEGSPPMRAIDVREPQRPQLADTYDAQSVNRPGKAMAVSTNFAYLLSESGPIESVDITKPSNLTKIGGSRSLYGSSMLTISGGHLYVSFGDARCANEICDPMVFVGGFEVFTISPRGGVGFLRSYSITQTHSFRDVHAWDVAVAGNYAYVAHTYKLAVVDVSDPKAPFAVGQLPLDCWRIIVSGEYAYVAGRQSQVLAVIDIREPTAPFKVEELATRGRIYGMAVAGQHLYLSSSNLVEVFDLSDPEKPVSVGSAPTKGEGLDLAVEGNLIYVADGSWGLQIFQVDLVRLEAELAGSELRLRWAADATNYILQSTLTLTDPQWEAVGAAPQVQDGFNVVKLPANSPAAFFRLLRP